MTITKEGTLVSFYTVNKAHIKHLRVYFSPKQVGSGDASPENVRETEGWNGLNLYCTGKNLFNNKELLKKDGYFLTDSGIESISSNGKSGYTLNFIPVMPNSNYTFSAIPLNNRYQMRIYQFDKNYQFISRTNLWDTYYNFSITTDNNCYYIQLQYLINQIDFSNLQIEFSNRDATKYEPYHGHTYNLDWSNDIGTIYGGYVDLITGEVVKEYDCISRIWGNWTSATNLGNNTRKACSVSLTPIGGNAADTSLCNLTNNYLWSNSTDSIHFYVANSSDTVYAVLPNDLDENQEIQISYKLKTPITYQLTPQQLQTFIGQNNIWSNTDRVEVEYDLAESNDELYKRRNIILQGAPHLESVSGNIANFNTDLIAPIKDAKIYFNPIQEGEGDPSPENVRNISGWNGMTLSQSQGQVIQDATNEDWAVGWMTAGGILNTSSSYRTSDYIPVTNGATVRIKFTNKTSDRAWYCITYYDNQKKFLIRNNNGYDTEDIVCTVSYEGLEYIRISINRASDVLISIGPITTNLIDWSSIGTVYGGYVDLITGDLYQTYGYYNLGDNNLFHWNYGGGNGTIWYGNIANNNIFKPVTSNNVAANMYCTQYKVLPYGSFSHNNNMDMSIGWDTVGAPRIRNNAYNSSTATEFKASLDGIYAAVELKNSIYITTLTPQQLLTLKGTNNIWSDANGPVSITYWTH